MKWTDLRQLDSLILETEKAGAQIEEIGVSAEGRPLYGVTAGDRAAARTVFIIAGCHANEPIGPLTAVSLIQSIVQQPAVGIKFKVVPVVDPDLLHRNAVSIPTKATLHDLLNTKTQHYRDLEGHFTANTYPECVAVRQWMQKTEQIDAYFSLHSAGLISPGLFFYVGNDSDSVCVDVAVKRTTAATPRYLPLLTYDPTGESQTTLAPGFMEIATSKSNLLNSKNPNNSLTYVTHHFRPKFIGVSEMPLAVCPALHNAALSEIDKCNREFRQTGHISHLFQEISINDQLAVMRTFVESVAQYIAGI